MAENTTEKPVLNEPFEAAPPLEAWKWDFPPGTRPSGGGRQRRAEAPVPAEEKTGETPDDEGQLTRGLRLFRMKRWEYAVQELLRADTGDSSRAEQAEKAYYLGLCCTKLERFDEALVHFEQVIITADSPMRVYQCRMIIAYIYIVTERAQMAETELKRLQDGGLESVMLYNTLAYAAYVQKNYLNAIEWYEKSLEIEKDNTTALNSLGYILADTGLDKLKGLRLCRKAVDKNPQNAAYLDSLGWASYKCGKLTDARNWLRRALDAAPQDAEIKKHLVLVTGGAV